METSLGNLHFLLLVTSFHADWKAPEISDYSSHYYEKMLMLISPWRPCRGHFRATRLFHGDAATAVWKWNTRMLSVGMYNNKTRGRISRTVIPSCREEGSSGRISTPDGDRAGMRTFRDRGLENCECNVAISAKLRSSLRFYRK